VERISLSEVKVEDRVIEIKLPRGRSASISDKTGSVRSRSNTVAVENFRGSRDLGSVTPRNAMEIMRALAEADAAKDEEEKKKKEEEARRKKEEEERALAESIYIAVI
jgi:hypothetical protein